MLPRPLPVALLLVALASACGDRPSRELMRRVQQTSEAICACEDLRCADTAFEELTAWTEKHAKKKPPEETLERLRPFLSRMFDCYVELVKRASTPPTPPPVEFPWAEKPPEEDLAEVDPERQLARLESLADVVCLCQDTTCSAPPLDEMQKLGSSLDDDVKLDPRYLRATNRASTCSTELVLEAAERRAAPFR